MSAPERLRALVAEATPGPWWYDGRDIFHKPPGTNIDQILIPVVDRDEIYSPESRPPDATLRLAALAPQLAELCANMGEALRSHVYTLSEKEMREKYPDSLATVTFDLLARLDALFPAEEEA